MCNKYQYRDDKRNIDVNVEFRDNGNKIVLVGDSGDGKTLLLESLAEKYNGLFIDGYSDSSELRVSSIVDFINKYTDKLILIDDGDDLFQDNALRYAVDLDNRNKYIIAGRDIQLKSLNPASIAIIEHDKNNISVDYICEVL